MTGLLVLHVCHQHLPQQLPIEDIDTHGSEIALGMLRLLLKFHDLACLRIGIHDTEAAGFPHGNLDNRNRSIRVVLSVAFQHLRVIHLIDVVTG